MVVLWPSRPCVAGAAEDKSEHNVRFAQWHPAFDRYALAAAADGQILLTAALAHKDVCLQVCAVQALSQFGSLRILHCRSAPGLAQSSACLGLVWCMIGLPGSSGQREVRPMRRISR